MALELKPQAVLELNEEMEGWAQLTQALPRNLPGAIDTDQWLREVMFPAFEASPVEIYRRKTDGA